MNHVGNDNVHAFGHNSNFLLSCSLEGSQV